MCLVLVVRLVGINQMQAVDRVTYARLASLKTIADDLTAVFVLLVSIRGGKSSHCVFRATVAGINRSRIWLIA